MPGYFTIKPTIDLCQIALKRFNNIPLEPIKMTYMPINSSISTTCHKLQGSTLENLLLIHELLNFHIELMLYY